MRKLYVMLDEWNYNRVFIEKELYLLRDKYDVTIICNDIPDSKIENIHYVTYTRKSSIYILKALLRFAFDPDAWRELKLASEARGNVKNKMSEVVRFYINAQLFYEFLCQNKLITNDSDAIYYSYWYFWKCFAITNHRSRHRNIKVLSRIHGYDLYNEQLPSGYQPFKKAMENRLDKLVFISEQGRDYYKNKFSGGTIDEEKCIISYLGTDNEYELKPYVRGDFFNLVSCSSLIELKQVDRIINALSMIDDVKVRWVHFGGGLLEDSIRQQASEMLSKKANIEYEIKGHTPNAEVISYYAGNQIDAFITTSSNEGMPMSIMEALSFGIPVIASPVGNIPNMIVTNGKVLKDNYSDADVAKAISDMANMQQNDYMAMRNSARLSWEEKYVARKNFNSFVNDVVNNL